MMTTMIVDTLGAVGAGTLTAGGNIGVTDHVDDTRDDGAPPTEATRCTTVCILLLINVSCVNVSSFPGFLCSMCSMFTSISVAVYYK